MTAAPYLYERQAEYWTSRSIEDYFHQAGFQVVAFPLTQLAEQKLPVDFLFHEAKTSKIFGIQYKALYHNGEDHWPINLRQRADLLRIGDWVYYGLSELQRTDEHRVARDKLIVIRPQDVPESKTVSRQLLLRRPEGGWGPRYFRWGGFVQALEGCRTGRLARSEAELREALAPLAEMPEASLALDVFLTNLEERRLVHCTPDLSQIGRSDG